MLRLNSKPSNLVVGGGAATISRTGDASSSCFGTAAHHRAACSARLASKEELSDWRFSRSAAAQVGALFAASERANFGARGDRFTEFHLQFLD